MPEPETASHLHLDEDYRVLVAKDQIQLPVTGSVVAFEEGVTSPPQVAQRELFVPGPREPVVQPPTPA